VSTIESVDALESFSSEGRDKGGDVVGSR
jgi:hypothetical protein